MSLYIRNLLLIPVDETWSLGYIMFSLFVLLVILRVGDFEREFYRFQFALDTLLCAA